MCVMGFGVEGGSGQSFPIFQLIGCQFIKEIMSRVRSKFTLYGKTPSSMFLSPRRGNRQSQIVFP